MGGAKRQKASGKSGGKKGGESKRRRLEGGNIFKGVVRNIETAELERPAKVAEIRNAAKLGNVAKMGNRAEMGNGVEEAINTSASSLGKIRGKAGRQKEGEVSLERAYACVKGLCDSLSRLHSKGLFPYNPSPLIKR